MPVKGFISNYNLCPSCNARLANTGQCWNPSCQLAGVMVTPLFPKVEPQTNPIDALVGQQINVKTATRRYVERLLGHSESQPKPQREAMEACIENKPIRPQRILGILRDSDNDFCLRLCFDRVPTNDDMRKIQDIMNLSFRAEATSNPMPAPITSNDGLLLNLLETTLREVSADNAGIIQLEVRLLRKVMLALPKISTIAKLDEFVFNVTGNSIESHWDNHLASK